MFRHRLRLFTILGFEISIDLSWLIIALLVTYSLAQGVFPHYYPSLSPVTHWLMGLVGAVLFFGSIIFHEFWHSLVARRHGLPMRGITLFLFGGVAEMGDEPRRPGVELMTAIAGPAASVVLGAGFYGLHAMGKDVGWPLPVLGVLIYLAFINWILAAFNMLPAFPLDGGRVLRSLLWSWRGDLRWATRMASGAGSIFGILLMVYGGINMLMMNVVGGLWYVFIGLFLRGAAQSAYQQVVIRELTAGKKVRDLMRRDPVTAAPSLSLERFVEEFVYRHNTEIFPVTQDGRLIGCIDLDRVRRVPRQEWERRTVGDLATGCAQENTISPDADISQARSRLARSGGRGLLVVENGQLAGLLDRQDLERFLAVRLRLGDQ
jgi:Zn-dependent protease/predicted transcriptional regulator